MMYNIRKIASFILLASLLLASFASFASFAESNSQLSKQTNVTPAKIPTGNKTTAKDTKSKHSFSISVSDQPPAGFENLDLPQTTQVDVYFEGAEIGSFSATFTSKNIRFLQANALVDRLPGIIDKPTLVKALSENMPTNSGLVCPTGIKRSLTCGMLSPEIAGVIFDQNNFKAQIFINKKYHTAAANEVIPLPPSDAGLSLFNTITGAAAGSISPSSGNAVSLSNSGVIAYKEGRINSVVNFISGSGGAGVNNVQLQTLNAQLDKGQYTYQAGLITTQDTVFYGNQYMLGAYAGTTLDTLQNINEAYGIPLEVFLPLPSQVNIYRDNQLLSSSFYDAGNQVLDTSALPDGAYDVTIVITNAGGTTQEHRFYIRSVRIAPIGHPQYYADAGVMQDPNSMFRTTLPQFTNIVLYQVGGQVRLSPSWGVVGDVLGGNNNIYATTGLVYIQSHYLLQPSLLISSPKNWGIGALATTTFGKLNGSLSGRKIWAHNNAVTEEPLTISNNPLTPVVFTTVVDPNVFAPITQNSTEASASVSYPIKRASVSFTGIMNKFDDQATTYSYGPTVTMPVFHSGYTYATLALSATRSQNQSLYLSTLTVNLDSTNWSGTGNLGYQAISTSNNGNSISGGGAGASSGSITSGGLTWKHLDDAQLGSTIGVNAGQAPGSNQLGSTYQYTGNMGNYNASVQRLGGSDSPTTSLYSMNGRTSFTAANNGHAVGGARLDSSGLIIDIITANPKEHDKFDVFANKQLVSAVKTNDPTPVFLTPYKTYIVTLKPVSAINYYYNELPQTVTLYPGNIKRLVWKAADKITIFGHILGVNHSPITNAIMDGGLEFNSTDDQGYIQAELLTTTKVLTFTYGDNQKCQVQMPNFKKDDFESVGDLTCVPVTHVAAVTDKKSISP